MLFRPVIADGFRRGRRDCVRRLENSGPIWDGKSRHSRRRLCQAAADLRKGSVDFVDSRPVSCWAALVCAIFALPGGLYMRCWQK